MTNMPGLSGPPPAWRCALKDAISLVQGKSVMIRPLIKCGKCADERPYGAILRIERPCAEACGMDAIGSDELGRAKIDYDKCVSCGMCLVNCPFGAISDKSQIFQLIQAIKRGDKVVAAVAPPSSASSARTSPPLPDAGGYAPGGLPQGDRGGGGRRYVYR